MKITQIRNATQIIQYAGKHFLSTRYSRLKEVIRVLPDGTRRNPQSNGRITVRFNNVLNVDALIVTHLHEDHWDETAPASSLKIN